ncbi:TIGR00730 family Rossman fold protein [Campylobacter sp. RM9344]|uniref:Cytokinin riboside 5'-monophosphate phosphoribohydrolase n=1 Tax=Campylobacter californiensis TaxID=1032243 RepID=A0AAW3ZWC0_9BACT|nr:MULTISPECIES: TIGR00730 family Rossman fold protein [unclassified Campylobacter]MBE2984369.1 TIGR00730 family Rossman fold protein [Campylobacter sp. RM6883]MBE2985707.1 TIGR00730 family Rossman fold protein [Campylobacter sp. RM12919]MBE2988773.1 TIGR00730 family Rossman fold protein [Campylobacter sp. RM12920]MBE2995804.1 TIGR00730 family Rossman fold protein [Campylobacter sp. RM6913]MBE3021755.1 TIGR00730 family Rossman fold protein [Campylobacter sp. 7477a]MBE3029635.1 TIGR00730 famil
MSSDLIEDFVKFQGVLAHNNKNVTFFGSARFDEENLYYKSARELAYKLGELGFAVLTGGGDGIMCAANKGAYESGKSPSVALNVRLPFEQRTNPYTTADYLFSSLSPRKFALTDSSVAFVVFPGGYGTLDELFEILVLAQVGTKKVKIFLFGSEFWSGLDNFIKTTLVNEKTINPQDVNLYHISDDIDYIVSEILNI